MSANDLHQQDEHDQDADNVVNRIGRMIRALRDNMRELGLDKEIEKAAEAIPDARDRLAYIGSMTAGAAERALNAVDRAQPLQDELIKRAGDLQQRWDGWFANPVELPDAKQLVEETREYLSYVPDAAEKTNRELLEITMAQDFQDLTGQVLKRMTDVIHGLEFELLQILLDSVPEDMARSEFQRRMNELKAESDARPSLLNGPQVNTDAADVMNNQDQVDDLLADLGF